ncbi:MAG: hypothetical protein P8183_05315 [Anaerolineae bacterium]
MKHKRIDSFPTMTNREWWTVVVVAIALASIMVLPYLLGHWLAPEGWTYTGLLVNVEDGTYLSAIEQGRRGSWTYRDLFTTEPHQPVFIEGFYLALGHVARWLGVTAVTMWHLGLWLADLILFILIYPFIAQFIASPGRRWTAYALVVLGSGFDWWRFPLAWERASTLEAVPFDLYVPEAHIFYSALSFPHFIAGIILIMLTFWWTMLALVRPLSRRRRWAMVVAAGLANTLLGVVYPFLLFLMAGVLGLYFLYLCWQARAILWPGLLRLAVIFLLPLPLFLYYAWAILTPNPLHLILAYLPYLILAALSLKNRARWPVERQTAVSLLWSWLTAVAILLYLPLNPQRRFVEGLQLPLAILATIGFYEVGWPWLAQTRIVRSLVRRPRYSLAGLRRLTVILLVLLVSSLNLYIYTGTAVTLGVIQNYPLFRPQSELAVMDWLQSNTGPNEVVLSSYWSGSYIPYRAHRVVVVGHLFETIGFADKWAEAKQFFAGDTDDAWRRQLLRDYDVDYVFYGRSERELGDLNPAERPYLQLAYEDGETAVYRVRINE